MGALTEGDIAHKVLLCKTPCPGCPFIPGPRAVKLAPGRLAQIARETVQGGQFFCHKALYEQGHEVLCRGWEAKVNPNAVRMAGRLRLLLEVRIEDLPVRTPEQIERVLAKHDHEDD